MIRVLIATTLMFLKKTNASVIRQIPTNHIASLSSPCIINSKYQPKTPNQEMYVKHLNNKNTSLVVAVGPAGTGKTLFACKTAIEELKKKKIEKVILTRPLISVANEDIGFLPGNLNKKMELWVQPMIDIFSDFFTKKEIQNYIDLGVIEITPLMYMRGRTFKQTIIIADEIQNTTPTQLLMLLTRCGEGSKIILTGDPVQSDLKEKNGLVDFMEKYRLSKGDKMSQIQFIELENTDVQRSELVKQILQLYTPVSSSSFHSPVHPPVHPSTMLIKKEDNSKYMQRVNNAISKIPEEYGDYIEPMKKPREDYNNPL
jgi:phosphate starvation-inducible PhoH-like protein